MDVVQDADYIEYNVGDFYYHKLLAKVNRILLDFRDDMNKHWDFTVKVPRMSPLVTEIEDYLKENGIE